ncbi:hypothetical protein Pint_30947 [Pistacia integerrima]|uniref:Uncharacterized protein n=1 Tax=Pistacia integerrima TaxID=434235 RepID=A0ACC0XP11_9ROSI|nr:hypothetical protein Pint_30947 [Pistacia integerrima]
MDSGASHHMTADGSNLMFKSNYPGCSKVQVINGESIPITHTSMLLVPSFDTHKVVKLTNILCFPKIAKNLLSISHITRDNPVIVEYHTDVCLVKDKHSVNVLLQGIVKNGLYQLGLSTHVSLSAQVYSNVVSSLPIKAECYSNVGPHTAGVGLSFEAIQPSSSGLKSAINFAICSFSCNKDTSLDLSLLRHARFHPNMRTHPAVLEKLNVKHNVSNKNVVFCEACKYGKLQQSHFLASRSIAKAPLKLVYSDLWGLAPVLSREGYRYYVIFVDDFSRFTWIYPLELKSEACLVFVQFHFFVEK